MGWAWGLCQDPCRATRGAVAGCQPALVPAGARLTSALSTKSALRGGRCQHKLHLFILFSLFFLFFFFFFFSSECLLSPSALLPHRYLFCCCLNCLTCMLHPCGGCWAETYLHGANWQMQPSADKTGGLVGLSSFTFSQQENKILFLEKDSIGVQTCQDSSEQQLPDCLPYSIRKSVLN